MSLKIESNLIALKFKVPHTLVLLFFLMSLSLVATWIIPSGSFTTQENELGRAVVIPGTFETVPQKEYLSITSLFTVVPRAFGDAQGIIFFVLIIGGALAVVRESGAIDALLGNTLRTFGDQPMPLLFFMMLAFSAASATLGMAEEYIPFAIILVSLCIALKMDSVTAIGTMVVGYGIGYGIAVINPFTLLIAQDVAGVPPASGMWFRLVIAGPIFLIGFHHVWAYARRVRQNPENSLVYDEPSDINYETTSYPKMTLRRKAVLGVTFITLIVLVVGIAKYEWYLNELGAMFLTLAVVAGIISGIGLNKTATVFGKGAAELTGTALLIGFARSIALIMEDGEILHTVVNGLATPLSAVGAEAAAVGMLFIQSALNFFIPSGSGQALVTMPLMAPIGDLVGVSRQIAVLAFQLGDGLMNMIVPTNPVLMGILGLASIPYDKWFKFIAPLMLKLVIACSIALVAAVWLGYS